MKSKKGKKNPSYNFTAKTFECKRLFVRVFTSGTLENFTFVEYTFLRDDNSRFLITVGSLF